jgi:two-component system sensor histidine kinase BaeS
LQVQSPDGAFVAGERFKPPPHGVLRVEIRAGGRLMGYLAQPRSPVTGHPELAAFQQQQRQVLWIIMAGALLLAALTAAATAGLILRPIRRLSSGAAALARREFGTRLAVGSQDELGQLAGDFHRLADALERFDLRQQQWLADIAHELRTPLAVLRGELEALIEGVRQADPQRMRSLHQEVLRLSSLVDDLHLLSLAESGGLGLHREPASLAELVTDSAARFRERFAARGFALEVVVPKPDVVAQLDTQRMEQVLANLLENVLRHATPGPVKLGATTLPDKAVLSVEDSGPGVPDAALPRLFDRLYRVDRARSRTGGGSGLGLAICRSIVQAHGGQIAARKSGRGGLEISITLPLGRA